MGRTQLQPRHPVVVSEVVSVVEAVDEVEASPSQRNGNPLPSSVDLSRTARSSPSRSRPEPVSEPDSRLLSALVTETVTSVLESSAPRKSPPPSVALSSLPSSLLSQSDEVTGVTSLVNLTPFLPRSTASAVPSTCDSSPLPEELVSFAVQSQRSLCRWPVLKIATPLLAAPPPPLETSPSPLSRLSARPTPSSPQTSGRKMLSPPHHTRSSPSTSSRTTSRAVSSEGKSRSTKHLPLFSPIFPILLCVLRFYLE